jgi:uncharacterized protein YecE (DUF72 family)
MKNSEKISKSVIHVGTAGWNYKDWYGIVYPENPEKSFKELDFIAQFFNTVEINSSFYRPPNSFMGAAWVRKVAQNPRFSFTAKLWQRFTHDRKDINTSDIKLYIQGIEPLMQAGKLGALLCQFPWSFKNDEESRKRLTNIITTFKCYPLVIELRHLSWDKTAIYEFLDKHDVGIASIDQPVIGKSIGFKPVRTGKIGYVRMHGRNYSSWFSKTKHKTTDKTHPSSRYDYLYTEEEIQQIAENVKIVGKGSKETFVIQNNHPWGQAVANAIQLRAALGEIDLRAPATMLHRYPQLKDIAQPVK